MTQTIFWKLRVCIIILALFTTVFAFTEQFADIYRRLALDVLANTLQILLAAASMLLFSVALGFVAHDAIVRSNQLGQFGALAGKVATLVAIIPWLLLGIALIWASADVPARGHDYWLPLLALKGLGGGLILAASSCLYLVIIRDVLPPFSALDRGKLRNCAVRIVIVAAVVLLALPLLSETGLVLASTWLGPCAIVLIGLSIYTLAFGWLSDQSARLGVPLIFILLVAVVVFDWIGWNDNHHIRTVEAKREALKIGRRATRPDGTEIVQDEAFAQWLDRRKSLTKPGQPFPVFLVTMQGGGIYAAHHAASTLARLQDECPAFSQHVFAISGVSGGSVGASVFASALDKLQPSIVAEAGCDTQPSRKFQNYVDAFFARDLLSPTIWQLVVPEFAQRLLPFPAIGSFDRARGLEFAIEQAGRAVHGGDFFERGLLSYWASDKNVPVLLFNVTQIGTGQQLHASSLDVWDLGRGNSLLQGYLSKMDLRISTAAGLSARFPVVASTGRLRIPAKDKQRPYTISLVDGGYSENSGVETMLDMYWAIQALQVAGQLPVPVELKVIVISAQGDLLAAYPPLKKAEERLRSTAPDVLVDRQPKSEYHGVFAPLVGLLAARTYRPTQARAIALNTTSAMRRHSPPGSSGETTFFFPLTNSSGNIPLGWTLSRLSRDRIAILRASAPITERNMECQAEIDEHLLQKFGDTIEAAMDRALVCHNMHYLRSRLR